MNTYLPYRSFIQSAECLDRRRLHKQVIEAHQMIRILKGKLKVWENHPAVIMWEGYIPALKIYFNAMYSEATKRGIKYSDKYYKFHFKERITFKMPSWLGRRKFHMRMRSNLLRKDPVYYGKYDWKEKPGMAYFWPVKRNK